jgi:DNA-binding transcriptional ArsR family regulator
MSTSSVVNIATVSSTQESKTLPRKLSSVFQPQPSDDYALSPLSPAALNLMANFFKALSEVSRLQIVCSLKDGAKNVTEIMEKTGLGQANVSKHLKMLTQEGILTREQKGVCVYYEISHPKLFELCDLVCGILSIQIEHQSQHLSHLRQTI